MKLPEIVGEEIDQRILPNYADGHNTAEMIYDIVLEQVNFTFYAITELETDPYSEDDNRQLIDCYWATPHNKQMIIDYIEKAWESWEVSE